MNQDVCKKAFSWFGLGRKRPVHELSWEDFQEAVQRITGHRKQDLSSKTEWNALGADELDRLDSLELALVRKAWDTPGTDWTVRRNVNINRLINGPKTLGQSYEALRKLLVVRKVPYAESEGGALESMDVGPFGGKHSAGTILKAASAKSQEHSMSDISRLQDLIRKAAGGTAVPEKIKAPVKQAPPAKKMPVAKAPREIMDRIAAKQMASAPKPLSTAKPAVEDAAAVIKRRTAFARQLAEALRNSASLFGGDVRE